MALHKVNDSQPHGPARRPNTRPTERRIVRFPATARGETMRYTLREPLDDDLSPFENAFARLTGVQACKK